MSESEMWEQANEIMWEKEQADATILPFGQSPDDEINSLKRRGKSMALKTTVEVERTDEDIRLVVTVGRTSTTYKLTAGLAKALGEDLFKHGCNLETALRNKSA